MPPNQRVRFHDGEGGSPVNEARAWGLAKRDALIAGTADLRARGADGSPADRTNAILTHTVMERHNQTREDR